MTGARHYTPLPHQVQALDALAAEFERRGEHRDGARAQVRMACGTGKTLLGYWLARRGQSTTVVVFAPSIALVGQTIESWRRAAAGDGVALRTLAVCSDPTTDDGRAEIGQDGRDPYAAGHDRAGVTTRAATVARYLDRAPIRDAGALTLIVSTYQSSRVVAEALRIADECRGVDLVICDEAHRLAGRIDPRFNAVLRQKDIPARRRLFQTATPVVLANIAGEDQADELFTYGRAAKALSMDDTRLFGPVVYELKAGEAIERGLLADYRVVVSEQRLHHGEDMHQRADGGTPVIPERAAVASLDDAVAQFGLRRVLTFHNRVSSAHRFAARLNQEGTLGGVRVRAFAVDGSTSDAERRTVLAKFDPDDEVVDGLSCDDVVTVVCSSQVLREGVDVPAVDAALFADPRSSTVSIVQAIGRVLRTYSHASTEGAVAKIGTVIIPLVMDAAPDGDPNLLSSTYSQVDGLVDDQDRLATSAFVHVWRVLRALRAHDERVAFDLDRTRFASGTGQEKAPPRWLHVVGDDPGIVLTRLLQRTSPLWEWFYGALVAEVERLGSAALIKSTSEVNGKDLGSWVMHQRILHRKQLLDPERADRLEQVPGWTWSAADAATERTLATLEALASARTADGLLGLRPVDPAEDVYRGKKDALRRPLGRWVAGQLAAHADLTIDSDLAARLETIAGWGWEPYGADAGGLAALRQFVAWEHSTNVPAGHTEAVPGRGLIALGDWIADVRRRKVVFKNLPSMIEDAIMYAAPIDLGHKGARQWDWKPGDVWWDLHTESLRQFLDRHSTVVDIPVGHIEPTRGYDVRLYYWIMRIRHERKHGGLPDDRASYLESIPGWQWTTQTANSRNVTVGDRVELGDIPHGRRGFYAGCRCAECVEGQRVYQTEAARASRTKRRSAWVDAADVTAHLAYLMSLDPVTDRTERIVTAGAIAAAAQLNDGIVRALLKDQPTCHPRHQDALLALSLDDISGVRTVVRSRGRRGIVGSEEVDPATTVAALDELRARGWSTAEIRDGIGMMGTKQLPGGAAPVTAAQERQFTSLLGWAEAHPGFVPHDGRGKAAVKEPRLLGPRAKAAEQQALDYLHQGYSVAHAADRTGLSRAIVASLERTLAA